MADSLNVIALISGGKDSLYSILHCLEAGHKLTALANLYPESPASQDDSTSSNNSEVEDIDSFMYQTVGHRIIPLYSEALGVPLYRRAITGTATQTERDYAIPEPSADATDETEDLIPLLQTILQQHPEANAVSTGAILSTYQRTRVESIAIRLGLTPLSYLWQYPFLPPPIGQTASTTGLLDHMAAVGCEARIIKVATGGLDDSILWADICSQRSRAKLLGMERFVNGDMDALRASVLGEGGEFETLALNGPAPLWKKRIMVDEASNEIIRGEGGTSSVRIGKANLIPKDEEEMNRPKLALPSMLDYPFERVRNTCLTLLQPSYKQSAEDSFQSVLSSFEPIPTTLSCSTTTIFASNLQFSLSITESELRASILQHISPSLPPQSPCHQSDESPESVFSSITLATILVRSMSSFASVNKLWASLFSRPNPPARVTISCGDLLPESVDFSISLVIDKGPRRARDGLHVQSWSYWAPANIGPYSQSITVPIKLCPDDSSPANEGSLVFIAGQIPLVPSSMTLQAGPLLEQAVLSLQHLWRIGTVQKVEWFLYGIAFLDHNDEEHISKRAQIAYEVWKDTHAQNIKVSSPDEGEDDEEDDSGPDAWDLKYGNYQQQSFGQSLSTVSPGPSHCIPSQRLVQFLRSESLRSQTDSGSTKSKIQNPETPPFLAVEVCSLPRSAAIEWQSLGTRGLTPSFKKTDVTTPSTTDDSQVSSRIHTTILKSSGSSEDVASTIFSLLTIPMVNLPKSTTGPSHSPQDSSEPWLKEAVSDMLIKIKDLESNSHLKMSHVTVYTKVPSVARLLPETLVEKMTVVPCYSIWTTDVKVDDEAQGARQDGVEEVQAMGELLLAMIVKHEL